MYHHSTNLSGYMLSHSSSGLQNILAVKLFFISNGILKKKHTIIFEADKSRASVFEASIGGMIPVHSSLQPFYFSFLA